MKKPILLAIGLLISAMAFSQSDRLALPKTENKDSIWIAKYKSENGVTKYLGSITLKTPQTNITDESLKVIGTVDQSGRLIYSVPRNTVAKGRYVVYNTNGQLLYMIKVD
ncbi:MAG: hypothetical protein HYR66_16335 [Sphingobacteriales bacterium]|nr:hypothetical protein [Sphingobacteriales bacterium]MBI3718417.1 hypothetical protein [Sphingobacteriales bacterium]